MAKKENKPNAMRILETLQIPFESYTYECDEFIDGIQIADMLGLPHDKVFKTLVTQGASKNDVVCVIPIAEELDMKKAARAVSEKSLEMVHVKDINAVTGYIRGGCTPIGMKKQYRTVIHESAQQFDEVIVSYVLSVPPVTMTSSNRCSLSWMNVLYCFCIPMGVQPPLM